MRTWPETFEPAATPMPRDEIRRFATIPNRHPDMMLGPKLIAYPEFQSAIAAAVGLVLVALRRYRSGGALIGLACLWLWLCATPAFAGWLQHTLERPYPQHQPSAYPHADAIMLVGGGKLPPLHGWNSKTDPALDTPLGMVLALYRADKASNIVISAGVYTSGKLVALLHEQGVPAAAIHPAGDSLTTRQDAVLATPILRKMEASRILLVTYPVHMPRSAAVFRHRGFNVVAAPSLASHDSTLGASAWIPSHKALLLTRDCLHEYLGLAWYRLRGWVTL